MTNPIQLNELIYRFTTAFQRMQSDPYTHAVRIWLEPEHFNMMQDNLRQIRRNATLASINSIPTSKDLWQQKSRIIGHDGRKVLI